MTVLIITNVVDIFALLLATRALIELFGRMGLSSSPPVAAIPIYLFVLGVSAKVALPPFSLSSARSPWPEFLKLRRSFCGRCSRSERYIGRLFLPASATHHARLFAAREELKQVAVQSEREGSLTSTERAMIHNVVDFRNVSVRDVMVPLERSRHSEA